MPSAFDFDALVFMTSPILRLNVASRGKPSVGSDPGTPSGTSFDWLLPNQVNDRQAVAPNTLPWIPPVVRHCRRDLRRAALPVAPVPVPVARSGGPAFPFRVRALPPAFARLRAGGRPLSPSCRCAVSVRSYRSEERRVGKE